MRAETLSVAAGSPPLEIVPLGGVGEFGMNMTHFAYGGHALLVDAGVMFPEPELLGVDLVIPDLTYLQQPGCRPQALVLTHGHEDHLGAVPYVLPHVDGPVYGTPLTLALLEPKLEAHGLDARDRLRPVRPRETITVGPFTVEFLRVTHSMPDCVALAIRTPVGTVVHSGDFKFDQTPLDGEATDVHRLAELGSEGVLALLGDSTNIERKGVTGSELDVVDAFEEIFTAARGKIVVAAFATSLHRIQILVDLAVQFGRKVAFVGRGMVENAEIAQRLGRLRIPAGVEIRDADARRYPDRELLCLTTGSQGEPLAALPRIAIDDHPHIKLAREDVVVISARIIPGNEKAVGRVMNHVARRGCELVYEGIKHVHVSGHGSEEELKLMLSLVKPRYFVPIHGEYRQLARHAWVASRVSGDRTTVMLVENGDRLRFDASGARRVDRVPAGRVLIDGTRTGEVADEVLRDRRHLAADGLVVPVVAIEQQSGTLEGEPEIVTRGVAIDGRTEALLRELPQLVASTVKSASIEERTDQGLIKERLRVELQRFFRKRAGRRPLVLPVVLEI
jgi:ribonuclease J